MCYFNPLFLQISFGQIVKRMRISESGIHELQRLLNLKVTKPRLKVSLPHQPTILYEFK
jgi:hypothetical protein